MTGVRLSRVINTERKKIPYTASKPRRLDFSPAFDTISSVKAGVLHNNFYGFRNSPFTCHNGTSAIPVIHIPLSLIMRITPQLGRSSIFRRTKTAIVLAVELNVDIGVSISTESSIFVVGSSSPSDGMLRESSPRCRVRSRLCGKYRWEELADERLDSWCGNAEETGLCFNSSPGC